MKQMASHLELTLPVSFIQEGDQIVAYTPALDLSTSGKDETEAKRRFGEIVNLFFADLIENGTVEQVLSDLGWRKGQSAWNPPAISQETLSIRVPAVA